MILPADVEVVVKFEDGISEFMEQLAALIKREFASLTYRVAIMKEESPYGKSSCL